MKNLSKITKLMQMTFSDNDNEAIMAIRAANRLLAKENLNWEQVLMPPKLPSLVTWEYHVYQR